MIKTLAQRLIAEERRTGNDSDKGGRAAFSVCEKLRQPLTTFAGAAGFRSLLARALVLAKAEAPLLESVQLKPDGSFAYSAELETQLGTNGGARAGAVLVGELLGLLITFIGEALTLRLVHDVWPNAALKEPRSGGKSL